MSKALENLSAIPIVFRFVVENERQAGEAKQRHRPQRGQMGNTVHYDFKGDGDLLFYLFSSAARPLRDDGNVIIRYVGICLDRKVLKGNSSPDEQQNGDRQYNKAVVKGIVDKTLQHYCSTVFCNTSASATTR